MIKEQDMETIKTWKIFILTHSILKQAIFWPMPKLDPRQFYGPTPPAPKFRPTSLTPFFWPTPKFYGPTPPMPKFYRPTPPTPPTPKFDPRHPRTHGPTLSTHPRYLADSFKIKSKNKTNILLIMKISWKSAPFKMKKSIRVTRNFLKQ